MRFTLINRISRGLAITIAIGVLSILIVAAGFVNLYWAIHRLADVEGPTLAAAYEIENTISDYAISVLGYVHWPDPHERERAAKSEARFEKVFRKYVRLVETDHARAPAQRMRQEYERLRSLGGSLMSKRDLQHELYTIVMSRSAEGDTSIARELQGIETALRDDSRTFATLRKTIDDMLEKEIQAEALSDLLLPRLAADRATRSVVFLATLLMPAFLVAVAAVSIVKERRLRKINVELIRQTADRERAEEERARLQVALRRSEVLSSLGSIVAGVSHEVRNPLFGISSTVDALEARLKRDRSEGKYARHVQVLRAELVRLSRLMHDLLEYGKPPTLDIAESSVADAVGASVVACDSVARSTGATIRTTIQPDVVSWPMDRPRMEQVLCNLLENAIQHSPGGTVTLDVRQVVLEGAPQLRVQVRDEGPGFDPAQLRHVFEPFFTRRCGGTGLGLSIVERIVDAHGGAVRASNCPTGGAEITVDLPRATRNESRAEVIGAA